MSPLCHLSVHFVAFHWGKGCITFIYRSRYLCIHTCSVQMLLHLAQIIRVQLTDARND